MSSEMAAFLAEVAELRKKVARLEDELKSKEREIASAWERRTAMARKKLERKKSG